MLKRDIQFFVLLCLSTLGINANAESYVSVTASHIQYTKPNVERSIRDDFFVNDTPAAVLEITVISEDGGPRPERIVDLNAQLLGINLKYGYSVFDWFSIEVRGGFSAIEEGLDDYAEDSRVGPNTSSFIDPITGRPTTSLEFITDARQASLKMEYYYGVYTRIGGGGSGVISPYVVLGQSRANFTVDAVGGTAGGRLDDFSYGLGANIRLAREGSLYINLEYMDLFATRDVDVETWTIGLEQRF